MVGEVCIEAKYSTNDLVNIALEDGLTSFHVFDLNMDLGDLDDQPSLVVQLSHVQMLLVMNNSQNFDVHDVMEFEKILERLKKMIIANCSKQHQRTLDTLFVSHL